MATTYLDVEGKGYWAKLKKSNVNEYRGKKTYCIDLELDDRELGKVEGAKIERLKIRSVGDGQGVRFSRDFEKDFGKGDGLQELGEPKVSEWDDVKKEFVPFKQLIGNGSKVRANVKLYNYKNPQGKVCVGHELMGVTVLDLVEYNPSPADPDQEVPSKEEVADEAPAKEAKPW